jgi:hypothetical protein
MVVDPDNYLVPFNLGVALEATDDNEGAIRACKKSLLMNTDFYATNIEWHLPMRINGESLAMLVTTVSQQV